MLKFTNYRSIEGADYTNDEEWCSTTWLKESFFLDPEVSQLKTILEEWDMDGSNAFTMTCDEFEGMAEVSMDRWDVTDESGRPLYTVWTYMSDSGMVFKYGTDEIVGGMVQFGGDFEDEELAEVLEAARLSAKEADPNTPLPGLTFT